MTKALVLFALALLGSVSVNAKTLTVSCEADNGKSLELSSTIANVNKPQEIESLVVNGNEVSQFRDVSEMPIYKEGNISLNLQFGRSLYSSVELSLSKCNDDFEATGKASLKEYVGGFAGTSISTLNCSCSLK